MAVAEYVQPALSVMTCGPAPAVLASSMAIASLAMSQSARVTFKAERTVAVLAGSADGEHARSGATSRAE
ncbi:hypothetical protein BVG81_003085 [Haliangium sp. UPWRP_2]|nr:hypothetical protein BVG81_003085 [Haliangium sp. UPWRP_2]